MECFLKKIAKVKDTKMIVNVMMGSRDPWLEVKSFVTNAISVKKLSKSEGKCALVFAACWIAEQYSKLTEQNEILHNKVECLDELYGGMRDQKENLEDRVKLLSREIEKLTVSAKSAGAMCISNQLMVAENKCLKVENEELTERLKAAGSHVVGLTASSSTDHVDQSKRERCETQENRFQVSSVRPLYSNGGFKPYVQYKPVKCFSCGRLGHIAKYCRFSVSESQEKDNKVKCFACGQVGHIARCCPAQKERHLKTCYTCGKAGHISRNCYTINCAARVPKDGETEPKMEGKERENIASWWKCRQWQYGRQRPSHCVPFHVVRTQNQKLESEIRQLKLQIKPAESEGLKSPNCVKRAEEGPPNLNLSCGGSVCCY